jgi:hypothetical protein
MIGIGAVVLTVAVLPGCVAPPPAQLVAVTQLGSSSTTTATVPAPYRPPPKRAEIPPPAPSPHAFWQSGHWRWSGERFVWVPGRYVERPGPTANWIPDYWQQGADGWIWVEGRWTS